MNIKWGLIGIVIFSFVVGLFVGFGSGVNAFLSIDKQIQAERGEQLITNDAPTYKSIIIARNAVKKGMVLKKSDFVIFAGSCDEVLMLMLNRCVLPTDLSLYEGHPVQCDINKDAPLFLTDLVPR
jgi:hypothetical protein